MLTIRRYIQKFYQMRTQLQAIALRIQTVRSNEQMMQSMKGATTLLGSMNRQMNLPALQRIAQEFERENDIMDQRQEMMDDAIDEVTGLEDEDEEEEVVNRVLDEIGIDLGQSVCVVWFLASFLGAQRRSLLLLRLIVERYADYSSWARHRPDFRNKALRKARWHRRLAEEQMKTTTWRRD
jgi:Snf7